MAADMRDRYGFKTDDDQSRMDAEFYRRYAPLLQERAQTWNVFMAKLAPGEILEKNDKLKKMVRLGIPMQYRSKVWQHISGSAEFVRRQGGRYEQLTRDSARLDNADTRQIDKDLPRTFSGHPYLTEEKLAAIKRMLVAFTVRNSAIGYCQAMNYIAALILMIVPNEEEAFWLLVRVLESLLPKQYYTNGMADSQVDQRVFVDLIQSKLPRLHRTLDQLTVPTEAVTSEWFLRLFVGVTPTETTLRIWDSFLFEGAKVLFRVGIAMFKEHEAALCAPGLAEADIYLLITGLPRTAVDCETLMKVAFNKIGSLPASTLAKLRTKNHEPRDDAPQ